MKFKDVVKFVTVFTISHCITLIFATFFKITWNYRLVDAIIAISVIYRGFDNNGGFQKHFNMPSPNLVKMVFIFGLLHGFGLSTQLHGYQHDVNGETFRFPVEGHRHIHEDMDIENTTDKSRNSL